MEQDLAAHKKDNGVTSVFVEMVHIVVKFSMDLFANVQLGSMDAIANIKLQKLQMQKQKLLFEVFLEAIPTLVSHQQANLLHCHGD